MSNCLRSVRDVLLMAVMVPPTVAFLTAAMFVVWARERFGGRG